MILRSLWCLGDWWPVISRVTFDVMMDFGQLCTHGQCFGPFYWLFLHCQLSDTCCWYLTGFPSMHCRRTARPIKGWWHAYCGVPKRLIIDLSQITRWQIHEVSLSSRQLIPTSAVFAMATIGWVLATTRRRISGISMFEHWLFGHTNAD